MNKFVLLIEVLFDVILNAVKKKIEINLRENVVSNDMTQSAKFYQKLSIKTQKPSSVDI